MHVFCTKCGLRNPPHLTSQGPPTHPRAPFSAGAAHWLMRAFSPQFLASRLFLPRLPVQTVTQPSLRAWSVSPVTCTALTPGPYSPAASTAGIAVLSATVLFIITDSSSSQS